MAKEIEIMTAVVENATPVKPRKTLVRIRADELPLSSHIPDELVDTLLVQVGLSMMFGESNCGKTFLALDLAACIAQGKEWLGHKVEQGAVVYLATESPASVKQRLAAYQKHHGVCLSDIHIVTTPINFHRGEEDVDAVLDLIRDVELEGGKPVRLVIGDTLARIGAGGNENASQDMSEIMRRLERIATEASTHVLFIHHAGKNAAAGARGWSGLNGAVNTELAVTVTASGVRCVEVSKQRDGEKGKRIGFQLLSVPMGTNKWNSPVTSCVVLPADAPKKTTAVRTSELDDKILALLRKHGSMRKREFRDHLNGSESNIYRQIKNLARRKQVAIDGDVVSLPDPEVQIDADAPLGTDLLAGN